MMNVQGYVNSMLEKAEDILLSQQWPIQFKEYAITNTVNIIKELQNSQQKPQKGFLSTLKNSFFSLFQPKPINLYAQILDNYARRKIREEIEMKKLPRGIPLKNRDISITNGRIQDVIIRDENIKLLSKLAHTTPNLVAYKFMFRSYENTMSQLCEYDNWEDYEANLKAHGNAFGI